MRSLLVMFMLKMSITQGFDPRTCEDHVEERFDSNGFDIMLDSYSAALMDVRSDEIDGLTYREAIDFATGSVRDLLGNVTSEDGPYNITMAQVPFLIESVDNGDHFFYSGRGCSTGCVVTQLPERLIRDIYVHPTLLIHEYAHVYEDAVPNLRKDADDAYRHFVRLLSIERSFCAHKISFVNS